MPKNSPKSKGSGGGIWWVVGVAAIGIGVLVGLSVMSANKQNPVADAVKTDADMGAVRTVKGKDTAKVTVLEYGDYL